MKSVLFLLQIVGIALLTATAHAQPVVADIGADFQPTTPKAGWSYIGSTAPTGGSESPMSFGGLVAAGLPFAVI